jgi:5'-3' exonuclease
VIINKLEGLNGMKAQDRKEKAFLHKALIDILTDCPNDMAYLKRLIFAQEIITKEIEEFSNEEYMDVVMELEKS